MSLPFVLRVEHTDGSTEDKVLPLDTTFQKAVGKANTLRREQGAKVAIIIKRKGLKR